MNADRRSYMLWITGAGVLVVALIGAVVIGLTQSDENGGRDPSAIVETNAVEIEGTLPPASQAVNVPPSSVLSKRSIRAQIDQNF